MATTGVAALDASGRKLRQWIAQGGTDAATRLRSVRPTAMLSRIETALASGDLRTDGGRAARGGVSTGRDALLDTPGRTADHGEPTGDELDQLFWILRNQRRRHVLRYLSTTEGPVTLSDLAEQVAAWEYGKEIRQIDAQERKCVYVGMYQCHLPKMADASAIAYDKRRGIVEPGEQFDTFEHYLQLAD